MALVEEAAVLLELTCERGKLLAGLRQVVGAGGEAIRQLGDAVGVGGRASGDALQLDGGLVGLRSGLADLLIERVAVADSFGVFRVHRLDGGGLCVDLRGKRVDLLRRGGLLGVELGHAAGEHNAKPGAKLVTQRTVTLGLGGLAFEGSHLARYFFEDVVDAGRGSAWPIRGAAQPAASSS